MSPSTAREEILESIERDRAQALVAVHELTEVARESISLRDHIRNNPMAWLAGAFVVGLWLGHRRSPRIVISTEGEA